MVPTFLHAYCGIHGADLPGVNSSSWCWISLSWLSGDLSTWHVHLLV